MRLTIKGFLSDPFVIFDSVRRLVRALLPGSTLWFFESWLILGNDSLRDSVDPELPPLLLAAADFFLF